MSNDKPTVPLTLDRPYEEADRLDAIARRERLARQGRLVERPLPHTAPYQSEESI